MEFLTGLLEKELLDISVKDILIVVVCILIGILADKLTRWAIKRVADRPGKHVGMRKLIVESLSRPLHWFCLTVGCSLGLLIMDPPAWGEEIWVFLRLVFKSISIWCVVWVLLNMTNRVTTIMSERAKKTESKLDDMLVPIASGVVKFVLLALGTLVIAQNMGYSVSSLLAGLGLGGAAIALAAKDTIANMFGALVVFFDKPFEIGDWVEINGVEGEVVEIRLRVTVIRTFSDTLVTMPNSVLSSSNISNWDARRYRKMDCGFGLLYSTKSDQIVQIVNDIKAHIASHPETFGPSYYVNFDGFGDSSFNIRVDAFTRNEGLAKHYADKQEFMLEIMRIVERAGAGFAFPTRTLDVLPNAPLAVRIEK